MYMCEWLCGPVTIRWRVQAPTTLWPKKGYSGLKKWMDGIHLILVKCLRTFTCILLSLMVAPLSKRHQPVTLTKSSVDTWVGKEETKPAILQSEVNRSTCRQPSCKAAAVSIWTSVHHVGQWLVRTGLGQVWLEEL